MGTPIGTGFVDLKLRVGELERALKKVQGDTKKSMGRLQHTLNKINVKKIGLAFTAMGVIIGVGVAKAISAASDFEETEAKFNTVFSGMEKDAERWAKTLEDNFGVSKRESRFFLSSMQDLLVPMGVAKERAGKLSFEVVKLATDLGSFNNLPTETVMQDMQSALVGNFEVMKKYGVVLKASTVAQRAMNEGMADSVSELTAADKAQAALLMITEASAAAVGDFQRTSDGFANQMKILKARFADMVGELGQKFLPEATELVGIVREAIPVMKGLSTVIVDKLVTAFKFWVPLISKVVGKLDELFNFSNKRGLKQINEDIQKLSDSFKRGEISYSTWVKRTRELQREKMELSKVIKKETKDVKESAKKSVKASKTKADAQKKLTSKQRKEIKKREEAEAKYLLNLKIANAGTIDGIIMQYEREREAFAGNKEIQEQLQIKYQKKIDEAEKRQAKKREKAEEELAEEKKKTEKGVAEYTIVQLTQIANSEKATAKERADAIKELSKRRVKAFSSSFKESLNITKTKFEKMADAGRDFGNVVRTTNKSVLEDALKGNLQTADQYWKVFKNSVISVIAGMLADFIASEIAKQVAVGTTTGVQVAGAAAAGTANVTAATASEVAWTAAAGAMMLSVGEIILVIAALILIFENLDKIIGAIGDAFEGIGKTFETIGGAIIDSVGAIEDVFGGLKEIVGKVWDLLKSILTLGGVFSFKFDWPGWSGKGTVENFLGIDVPFLKFARGGQVPGLWNGGQGIAGDTVPAILTPGEYVIPRSKANDKTRTTLEYIQKYGDVPKPFFSFGIGPVSISDNGVSVDTSSITGGLGDIGDFVTDQLGDAWSGISDVWEDVKRSDIVKFAEDVRREGENLSELVKELLNDPWALVKRMFWDNVGSKIMPNMKFPGLAEGGIVTAPTFAQIGERGPEAVIPLKDGAVPVMITNQGDGQPIVVNAQINGETLFKILFDASQVGDLKLDEAVLINRGVS